MNSCKNCKFWDADRTVNYFAHHSYARCQFLPFMVFVVPIQSEQQPLMTHYDFLCKFHKERSSEDGSKSKDKEGSTEEGGSSKEVQTEVPEGHSA